MQNLAQSPKTKKAEKSKVAAEKFRSEIQQFNSDGSMSLYRSLGNHAVSMLLGSDNYSRNPIYPLHSGNLAATSMHVAEDSNVATLGWSSLPFIQRTCAACREEEEIARKAAPEGETIKVTGVHASIKQLLERGGKPLDNTLLDSYSARLGQPLDHVRIHTGPQAANMASALNARAFTVGQHIVFADGAYNPTSKTGQRLVAHELAHTLQQRSGRVAMKRGEDGDEIGRAHV